MLSDYHNLPTIDGAAQKNGRQYKAENIRFDAKTMRFSLDISGAYDSAGVRQWNRSITLKPNGSGLELTDEFVLNEVHTNNQINFMCAQRPDISQSGQVVFSVEGEELGMQYDPRLFVAEVEPIALSDKRLIDIWEAEIYRLRLKSLQTPAKGTYRFVMKKALR